MHCYLNQAFYLQYHYKIKTESIALLKASWRYSKGINLFRASVDGPVTIQLFNIYSTFQNRFFEGVPTAEVFSRALLLRFTYVLLTRLSFRGKN